MNIDEIILDSKKVEVLSSSSRVDILKLLKERNMTASEISNQLNLSNSTVHQHLIQLVETGFINKNDDGHKWKYYSLSGSGEAILNPHKRCGVFFMFSSLILFIVSIISIAIYLRGFVVKSSCQPVIHEPIFFFTGELFLALALCMFIVVYRRKKYTKISENM